MARLDRLGRAKEVAQVGAAIGREFSHTLIASVVRTPAVELGLALDRLIQAGLLFRQGAPPQATYLFKHALVQDAAYGTLLREPRRALHARIAETAGFTMTPIVRGRRRSGRFRLDAAVRYVRCPRSNHIRRPRRAYRTSVNHRMLVDIVNGSHDAILECLADATRMWRRMERVSLEKNVSTMFSHEPCLRVKMSSNRPAGEPSILARSTRLASSVRDRNFANSAPSIDNSIACRRAPSSTPVRRIKDQGTRRRKPRIPRK
jgi:hypothetical protein